MTPGPPSETASRGSTSPPIPGTAVSTADTRTMPPGTSSRSSRSSVKLRRQLCEERIAAKEREIAGIEREFATNETIVTSLESAVTVMDNNPAVKAMLDGRLRYHRATQRDLKNRLADEKKQLDELRKERTTLRDRRQQLADSDLIAALRDRRQRLNDLANAILGPARTATKIIADTEENEISNVSGKKRPAVTTGPQTGKFTLPSATKCAQSPADINAAQSPEDINAEDDDHGGTMVPGRCSHLHSNSSQRGGTTS